MSKMTHEDFTALLVGEIQSEERRLRAAGQSEYARSDDNPFANFDRVAEWLGLKPEQVLLVYALKHLDGIMSYVAGHKSQREDVRGRIADLRLYLAILWGMVERTRVVETDREVEEEWVVTHSEVTYHRPERETLDTLGLPYNSDEGD